MSYFCLASRHSAYALCTITYALIYFAFVLNSKTVGCALLTQPTNIPLIICMAPDSLLSWSPSFVAQLESAYKATHIAFSFSSVRSDHICISWNFWQHSRPAVSIGNILERSTIFIIFTAHLPIWNTHYTWCHLWEEKQSIIPFTVWQGI